MNTGILVLSGILAKLPNASLWVTIEQPLTEAQHREVNRHFSRGLDPWRASADCFHLEFGDANPAGLCAWLESEGIAYLITADFRAA